MNTNTKKLVMSSMFAALCCIATMIIKIPSPLKGYINLGDCMVLLSGFILTPVYGFLAAGLGSALADIFSGYIIYAPATFIIKGMMAIITAFVFKFLTNKTTVTVARIICAMAAEIVMILGYLVFESFLYGFEASIINIPANAVQGLAGLVLGVILMRIYNKFFSKFLF